MSTPATVERVMVVELSDVSWTDAASPVRTVKSFGRRMRSVVPILAPLCAKELSYCVSTFWRKALLFFHRRTASLVIAVIVRRVLGIGQNSIMGELSPGNSGLD